MMRRGAENWLYVIIAGSLLGFLAWENTCPVVISAQADEWAVEGDKIYAHVTGTKIRQCTFIANSPAGYALHKGMIAKTGFQYLKDPKPGSSRPIGKNDFGIWLWTDLSDSAPDALEVTVEHRCLWTDIQTRMGPFVVPDDIRAKFKGRSE